MDCVDFLKNVNMFLPFDKHKMFVKFTLQIKSVVFTD